MLRGAAIVIATLTVTACARPTPSPEQILVERAIELAGGRQRLLTLSAFSLEGDGTASALGEGNTPYGPQPRWKVSGWRVARDLENDRMRVWQTREPTFAWPLPVPPPLVRGLDRGTAYTVDGTRGVVASSTIAAALHIEMLHHPLVLLRAALDQRARLGNHRQEHGFDVVDLTTAGGDTVALGFDPISGALTKAWSRLPHEVLGDVTIETAFYRYVDAGGVSVPMRIISKVDGYLADDIRVSRYALGVDVRDAAPPGLLFSSPGEQRVSVEKVGPGVWRLAGSSHHSVLVEFDHHLVLLEVPESEARTQAVIAAARQLAPGKPLTHAVVSHHHFGHIAGVRAAVAEGLTIVAGRDDEGIIRDVVRRPHSLAPDSLSRHPQPLKLELVDNQLVISDATNELHISRLQNGIHSDSTLISYLPRVHTVVQADLFSSEQTTFPFAQYFEYHLRQLYTGIEEHVPLHGAPMRHADLIRAVSLAPN